MIRMKRGLAFKLTLGGVLAVVIPVLVIGLFSVMKSSKAMEEAGKSQSTEIAKSIANMVELVLREEIKVITDQSTKKTLTEAAIKASKEGAANAAAEIEAAQKDLALVRDKIGQDYESIFVADANGVIIAQRAPDCRVGVMKECDCSEAAGCGQMGDSAIVRDKKTGLSSEQSHVRELIETEGAHMRREGIEGFEKGDRPPLIPEAIVNLQEGVIGPLLFAVSFFGIDDETVPGIWLNGLLYGYY